LQETLRVVKKETLRVLNWDVADLIVGTGSTAALGVTILAGAGVIVASPAILTGAAIVGTASAIYFGARFIHDSFK
jgi:hypothetical protein